MKPFILSLAALSIAIPAFAQEKRETDAHVHGVTTAEVAVEHGRIEIDLKSPGMDIVGFEYAARTPEDRDAVDAAIRTFLSPEQIVTLPDATGCRLTEVLAHVHAGDDEHDEGHDDDHDHKDHADSEEAGGEHSAFHVTYAFACDDEDAITSVGFPFFERFDNAQEIEAQFVTETGADTAELTRGAPELILE
jgi:hypothetical protein